MSRAEWDAYGDPVRPDLDERGCEARGNSADPLGELRQAIADRRAEQAAERDRDALDRMARWQEWND